MPQKCIRCCARFSARRAQPYLSAERPTPRAFLRFASICFALLALFVVLYAGVFLSLYPAVPFLNSPLVPIVFVASALATGA
ncbi:NrfD/PsrC family molybdoenzyme membrane anchor subunit, partial [Eggerthella lenta]|uniref:NrfD/PsrC family molybdoenzyme membrane anchor subunit n=1 Tax=Eggerthella lenta TaxID=84112 RepID=UPI00216322C6